MDILRGSIAEPGSLNRYAYVQNDPVNFVDPSGQSLSSWWNNTVSKAKSAAQTVANTVRNAWQSVKNAASSVASWLTGNGGSKQNTQTSSASSAVQNTKNTITDTTWNTSTSQSSRSSNRQGNSSGTSSSTPQNPSVWNRMAYACEKAAKTIGNTIIYIWGAAESFDNGVSNALIRNFGQPGTDLIGALEQFFTGKTEIASRLQSSLNSKLRSLENDKYPGFNLAGKIFGDIEGLVLDVVLFYFSSGTSASFGIFSESGAILVTASEAISVAGAAAGSLAVIDSIWKSSNLGKDIQGLLKEINGNKHLIGENGTQISSKTVWERGKTERIDVENPNPGVRDGQIHYHDETNQKWLYDIENGVFIDPKTKELAPSKIQELLNDDSVIKAIEKALRFLGET